MIALHGAEVIDLPGALGSNGAIALARDLGRATRASSWPMNTPTRPILACTRRRPARRSSTPFRSSTCSWRAGDRRHAHGRRPVPAPGQAGGANHRGRAAARRGRAGPPLARRWVRPGGVRPDRARRPVRRLKPRGRRRPRASCSSRRASSPGLHPARCSPWRPRRGRPWIAGTIVALLPDGGWKYLSAGTYDRPLDDLEDALEAVSAGGDRRDPPPTTRATPAGTPRAGHRFVAVAIRDAIVEHARAASAERGVRDRRRGPPRVRWRPGAPLGAAAEPARVAVRYAIDPQDLLRLTIATDDADEVFWAIVHSHVASPARPSPTDLREAHYPDALYLLVSLSPAEADAATGAPCLRAWRIVDGSVHEVRSGPWLTDGAPASTGGSPLP